MAERDRTRNGGGNLLHAAGPENTPAPASATPVRGYALPLLGRLEQTLEGAGKMRLVKHHQRVAAQQPRRVGPHAAGQPVALEQEPRAHHVHGADDDRRRRWISHPFPVVHVPAAQGGDRQRPVAEVEGAPYSHKPFVFLQRLPQSFGEFGRLIDHGAPVHDVDEAPGQGSASRPRQQPDRHDGGLAQPGRDVYLRGQAAARQPFLEKPLLPRKGPMPGQRLEGIGEIERGRCA